MNFARRARLAMQFYLLVVLVFALLVAVFAVQNAGPVDVRFLGWHFPNLSLALLIIGSLILGAFLALIPGLARQASLRRQLRQCRQQNRELLLELDRIRQAALEDTHPLPGGRGSS
ncbi:MAG: lipopolysaccharide assembly protein LapA domain-containing protein [Moorellales bacterium]